MQHLHNEVAIPIPQNINGLIFNPGVYEVTQPAQMGGHIKLQGGPQDEFIFNFKQNLVIKPNTEIELVGGVKPENVYFNVKTQLSIGTNSKIKGNFLAGGNINAVNLLDAEESRFHGGGNVNLGGIPQTGLTAISNVFPMPQPIIIASGPTTFCEGGSVTLTANSGAKAYQWNTGETTKSITVTQSGTYTVVITFQNNCVSSSSITIIVLPNADATINPIPTLTTTQSPFTLTAANSGGIWSGIGITDPINGIFDPSIAGFGKHIILYTISGTCGDYDQKEIVVAALIDEENFEQPYTSNGHVFFDRFGNTYTENELIVVPHSHGGGHCLVGNPNGLRFQLDFVGPQFETPFHSNEAAMRGVICEVFRDLAYLITPGQCNGNYPIVNIMVQSPSNMPSQALGSAASFYNVCCGNDNTGIIDGEVWKAINTGVNDASIYDGVVNVNFNFNWNFNPACTTGTCVNQYDAYSVFLHETIHLLGFHTLIGANGQSISTGNGLSDHYSRFDSYLNSANGDFIEWDGCYGASFDVSVSDITAGCNNINFTGPNALSQPVFSPTAYMDGSSLSHFDNTCANVNYVMNPFAIPGIFTRAPTFQEVNALCDLGYATTGTFGNGSYFFHANNLPSCGTIIAGVNDGFEFTCSELIITNCTTSITVNPLANDIGPAGMTFECLDIKCGFGSVSNTSGTSFTYNPQNDFGIVTLTYIPVGPAPNFQRGNITCINILVNPCNETCATPLNCNQVCNSGFENYATPCTEVCSTFIFTDINSTCMPNGTPFQSNLVNSWKASHGDANILNDCNNNSFVSMWSIVFPGNTGSSGEGIFTTVNIQPNKNYIFSYRRRKGQACASNTCNGNNPSSCPVMNDVSATDIDNIFVRLGAFSTYIGGGNKFNPNNFAIPNTLPPNRLILHEQNVSTISWEQVTICFSTDANESYNLLAIYPKHMSCPETLLWVDDVVLIEDNFTAGPDQNTCGEVIVGVTPLCTFGNTTYTWSWQQNGANQTNQAPQLIFPATNPLTQTTTFNLTRTAFPANPNTVIIPSANTCITNDEITVTVNTPIILSLSGTEDICNGNIGTASVIASGGASPYLYEWNVNGNILITQTITGLGAGIYNVTVTDANDCFAIGSIEITISWLLINVSKSDISCSETNTGQASAVPSNGTSPYTYLWSNGLTTSTITGLAAGTYIVTVTDDNGCTVTDNITINDPVQLEVAIDGTDVLCNGGSDGEATANPSGGTSPYTFQWDANANNQITQTANGLSAGTYSVTVTDANGCTATNSVHPGTITIHATPVVDVTCGVGNDGVAAVTYISSFATPYTYQWNAAANNQTTVSATGLSPGTYSVTVTDNDGCSATATANIQTICDGVDFLFYDCHSFLSCNAFNDPNITRFHIEIYEHNSTDGTCGGAGSKIFWEDQQNPFFALPTAAQCTTGWWTTAPPALGLLSNHTNLTDDYQVPELQFIPGRDYRYRLLVEYNGAGFPFTHKGYDDCLTVHFPFRCGAPPNSRMAGDNMGSENIPGTQPSVMDEKFSINIYPSPAQNELNIEIKGMFDKAELEIINILGQKIFSAEITNAAKPYRLNTSAWNNGIYNCIIRTNGKILVNDFTIIK